MTSLRSAPLTVAALYRFTRFDDPAGLCGPLLHACRERGVFGTLLLAHEGINGTIAGPADGVAEVLAQVRALPGCAGLDVKLSATATLPFHRLKVRVKREIVTMGEQCIDSAADAGAYVEAADWNALIADPDTIVIDTRNAYEVAIGTFDGAIDPGTARFSDFPAWFRGERERLLGSGRQPRVAMFCTGGIRCEKATALLRREGVDEVHHLRGGILRYLEEVPAAASRWRGECFVFDARVAVGHGLAPGTHSLCHACRRPVSPSQMASPRYEAGVSCAACRGERSDEQRASYRERHRQEALAAARGRAHVGAVMAEWAEWAE